MSTYHLALTTTGRRSDADRLATVLVKKKLAACVQIVGPVRSVYFWKGKFCRDREFLLVIKTTSGRLKTLEKELHRIHPYDLPEFVVLPIVGGSKDYLRWLKGSLLPKVT